MYNYEITYEKNDRQRKTIITRKEGQIDCPGCGDKISISCKCGTKSLVKKIPQPHYKARC